MFNYNLRGRVPLSNGLLALSGNVLHSLLWFAGNVRFFALFFVLPSLTASGCEKNKIQDENNQKINVVKLEAADSVCAGVLYDKILGSSNPVLEVKVNGAGQFTTEGLNITTKGAFAELNKFYALAERKVRYRVVFSGDAKAVFRSSEGDFCATIDIPGKRISLATVPVTEKTVSFLSGNREYRVEISHIYQQAGLSIIDVETGDEAVITAVHDGQGGYGSGALQAGFGVGMQWDRYCFGLNSGSSMLVKQITVFTLKNKVKVLIYGDSITQPEGYFPTRDFHKSWTQLILAKLNGNAMSAGRGGGTITMLADHIRNELPYIEAEYVMITIGTNGGNSESNLGELTSYIISQGSIPILNNVPCNESGTQLEINKMIDRVRQRFSIKGCKFDIATSLKSDGKEVDKSMMYWEDYSNTYGWQIYHHPNPKGGLKMFDQTIIDVPEIYE